MELLPIDINIYCRVCVALKNVTYYHVSDCQHAIPSFKKVSNTKAHITRREVNTVTKAEAAIDNSPNWSFATSWTQNRINSDEKYQVRVYKHIDGIHTLTCDSYFGDSILDSHSDP